MLDFPAASRLARELAELPDLAAWAKLATTPGSAPRGGRVSGATRTAPTPLRLDVASYLGPASPGNVRDPYGDQDGSTPLAGTLAAWVRIHVEESTLGAPRSGSIGDLLAYLGRRDVLAWTVHQLWADEYAAEIHNAWRTLDAYAATRPRRRALQLPCPRCGLLSLFQQDGQDAECGNESCRAVLRPDDYDRRVTQYLAVLDAA
ncbi:hypothetical protein [Kitasatospora sp. A2-31]|uniref:hypothetical protein n=1 Tax=Kitasatospora sp. A2-31 TaxID=2916414 RepID=UPI001EED36C0|nr:hypothetical protein [Kitasatospora sp. A2-31]MCG6499441.1 hypothetical protein [Kitasatospora sp. A2-31]